jgi:hypothetical protein
LYASAEDVELISAVLKTFVVKIPSEAVVAQMIYLAAEQNISVVGLARFIAFKCETRSPEIAGFFLKSIPQDMPHWAQKHGAQYMLNRHGEARERYPSCEIGAVGAPETENTNCAAMPTRTSITNNLWRRRYCRRKRSGY